MKPKSLSDLHVLYLHSYLRPFVLRCLLAMRWHSNVCCTDKLTKSDLVTEQGEPSWSRSQYTFVAIAVNQTLFWSKFIYNKFKNSILTSKETHSINVSRTKLGRTITVPVRIKNTTDLVTWKKLLFYGMTMGVTQFTSVLYFLLLQRVPGLSRE